MTWKEKLAIAPARTGDEITLRDPARAAEAGQIDEKLFAEDSLRSRVPTASL